MSDAQEGTFSKLMEIADSAPKTVRPAPSPTTKPKSRNPREPKASEEDLSTVPYMSQNYRFTDDELRWLRRQSFDLSERLGVKVSQNTVIRVAIKVLREICESSSGANPLTENLKHLKR